MLQKSNIIEIGLLTTLFIGIFLKIYNISTDYFLLIDLLAINVFWILRSKIFNENIKGIKTIENQLISLIIWGLVLNLCEIPNSTLLFKLSFLILSVFFIIKFLIKRKTQPEWFVRHEPWILSIMFLSFFLHFMHFPGAGILKILSLSTYSIMLIILGISFIKRFKNNEYKNFRIWFFIVNASISILTISILFYTMYWSGSRNICLIGLILTLIIASILLIQIIFYVNFQQNESGIIVQQTFKRIYVLVLTTVILFSLFSYQYVRLDFGNRPMLINSFLDCRYKYKNNFDENCTSCQEFKKLYQEMKNGTYKEGDK